MSHISGKASELQYILNDTEFMVDSSDLKAGSMNDIIYTDGNQAFVVNGHLLQGAGDSPPTLVLQEGEDIGQYLINDDKGELLIANIQNGSIDRQQETQQIIQYVDEDGNITDPPEIVFINDDDDDGIASTQENCTQYQLAELIDDNVLQDDEEETARNVDINNLTQQQNDGGALELNAADWYQYSVVRDDNLHHYAIPSSNLYQKNLTTNSADLELDVSTITGKNLLTGQVVTLDGYMDKLQRKIKSVSKNSIAWQRPKHNLNAFLNKKFNLGLTVGGRPLVGKIVYVGNKELEEVAQQDTEIIVGENNKIDENEITDTGVPDSILETFSNNCDPKTDQMHIQTKLLSKKSNQFQKISKILSDLMNMVDVNKQLQQRSIRIKIIDKYCNTPKKVNQHVSFISGYMELKKESTDNNEEEEEWSFVPDTLKADKISQKKYPNNINLTIMTTYQNNQSLVQVIFDESKEQKCIHCSKLFKNEQLLFWHLNDIHNQCESCKKLFDSFEELMQHKKLKHPHLGEGKTCPVRRCKKSFRKESALKKHFAVHKLDGFKCPTCPYSGISEEDLKIHSQNHANSCDICGEMFVNENKLNLHKRTHSKSELSVFKKIQSTKYYSCDICKRTFSRQSNLQRHIDIHKGAEQLFRCAICECSYHYISSLTRHIVQNHVQTQRPNFVQGSDGIEVNI